MEAEINDLEALSEEDRKLLEGEEIPKEEEVIKEAPKEEPKEEITLEQLQKQLEDQAKETENYKTALKTERYNNRTQQKAIDDLKGQFEELRKTKPTEKANFDDDPLTYTKEKLDQLEQEKSNFSEQTEEMKGLIQQQQFGMQIKAMEDEYRRTIQPDYDQAFKYLVDFRTKELANYGITDEAQVKAEIERNSFQLAITAINGQKNPAEVLYNTAKLYGYQPKEQPKGEPVNKLEDIAKGQEKASKTLSTSGTNETVDINAQALLDMEGEEFDKAFQNYFGADKKKNTLLG